MRRILGLVGPVVFFLAAPVAAETRVPSVPFELAITSEAPRLAPLRSTVHLPDSEQPVVLPWGAWFCAVRPTATSLLPGSTIRIWVKELLCWIPGVKRSDPPLAQIGTTAVCSTTPGHEDDHARMYIREGERIIRFDLSCQTPAMAPSSVTSQ